MKLLLTFIESDTGAQNKAGTGQAATAAQARGQHEKEIEHEGTRLELRTPLTHLGPNLYLPIFCKIIKQTDFNPRVSQIFVET